MSRFRFKRRLAGELRSRISIVGAVLFALLILALVPGRSQSSVGQGDFWVCGWARRQNCVIDGDTIRYAGVVIRLADIDAPETSEPKCDFEAALGCRTKHRLLG